MGCAPPLGTPQYCLLRRERRRIDERLGARNLPYQARYSFGIRPGWLIGVCGETAPNTREINQRLGIGIRV